MAMTNPSFEDIQKLGFTFPGAREWITAENRARLAQDAALITTPNTGVPVEITAYIDPEVVEVMTAPRRAREIFGEEKKGSWVNSYAKWRLEELTGKAQSYSDYANGVMSDVNENWQKREQHIYQTLIGYGDLELAISAEAKINLAAAKQKSAASTLDIAANKYYLLGVEDKDIYGILNDPNLPDAITPEVVDGETSWETKDTKAIYNDIRKLFRQLQSQSQGLITQDSPLVLALSPDMNGCLGAATDFNVSVLDMLNKYFKNLKVVVLPELSGAAGETVFLIATEVAGQRTGTLAFGEKMRSNAPVRRESSYVQKFVASTYGGIVLVPFAFAQMTGVE